MTLFTARMEKKITGLRMTQPVKRNMHLTRKRMQMKRNLSFLSVSVIFLLLTQSCEDKKFHTFMANVPEYLSYEDLRKSIEIEDPQSITQPGKIYFKDSYIFINEFMEGVHIIDISDPGSPVPLAYIPVPGNIDMAIKDETLYLDSYTDLVLIDISDPANPSELKRIEDILEYTLPPYDNEYPLAEIDEEEGVVIRWEVKEYTQEIGFNPYPWPVYWEYDMLSSSMSSAPRGGVGSVASAYGIGGSMARFLTYDDYLYLLQSSNMLKVINITSSDTAEVVYDKYVGWGLETMFIYEDYMYLGATDGMYILNLQDPESPFTTSVYRHITSCDPVVVQGNYAYVTLRSGNICGGTADLLEVIDISDKSDPDMIASYGMDEPYGLGISGTTLFICQGENGLVVYDASNPYDIKDNELAEFTDIKATDVIPVNDILFTIGDTGFFIYDYSDLNNIELIASIPVTTTS